ncbi:formyl transferase [Tirmania nivea]|nr:formyl transferase [Tirmania nivea]
MPTTQAPLPRVLVLISGNGSNLQALIDAARSEPRQLACEITHVISNKKAAYGLTRAAAHSIPTTYHNLVAYRAAHGERARGAYDADLARLVLAQQPDLVVCAGWMHILSPAFLAPLAAAAVDIINLHPALPGEFDGANAIARAYESWLRGEISRTGVMVHRVIGEVDRGEPLVTREVPFAPGETLPELEARMHAVEHAVIVEGARVALEQRARRRERQVQEVEG